MVVTNALGCSKTSTTVTVFTSCKLDGDAISELSIYPNPADGNFELNMEAASTLSDEAIIRIFNVTGQQVFSGVTPVTDGLIHQHIELNMDSGIYMVEVTIDGVTRTKQLVITR